MTYLLDTHAWVWAQLQPEKLSRAVATLLDAPTGTACLSPVTFYEVLLLIERGRLVHQIPLVTRDASITAWGGVPVFW